MKNAILIVLIAIDVLLLAILTMLLQPNGGYKAAQPSLRSRQAAVGRAVLQAARRDPTVAVVVRAAVQAAPEDDRALASTLLFDLQQP